MASAANRIGAVALRSTFRIRPRHARSTPSFVPVQAFHRSQPRRADNENENGNDESQPKPPPAAHTEVADSPNIEDAFPQAKTRLSGAAAALASSSQPQEPFQPKRRIFDRSKPLTPEEVAEAEAFLENPPEEYKQLLEDVRSRLEATESEMVRETEFDTWADVPKLEPPGAHLRVGFMAKGEGHDQLPDEPYEGDDITSLAHMQLDQHRELRQYMRIAAWEMPKLRNLAKPFEPPSSDRPLRFRYTTFMGESHPSENKVVLEFCTIDLPLKPAERLKLIKLLGPRYDPQTDLVKMSCESFSSQIQNKRYLGDLLGSLMQVAKGKGGTPEAKDSFEDIPVDFRHVKWNQKPQFPEAWKMTPERRQILQDRRAEVAAAEAKRIEEGTLVDGKEVVAESYRVRRPAAAQGGSLQSRVDKIKAGARSKPRPTVRI